MSYKPPEFHTAQEVFDFVTRHLARQGRRSGVWSNPTESYDGNQFSCRYRGDGGDMCAAGACMSDELWEQIVSVRQAEHRQSEDVNIATLWKYLPPSLSRFMDLIGDLQMVHDTGNCPSERGRLLEPKEIVSSWPRSLRLLAASNGLEDAVVTEVFGVVAP